MNYSKKEIKEKEQFICHPEKPFHFANSQTKNHKISILQIANDITKNVCITMRSQTWTTKFFEMDEKLFYDDEDHDQV